MWWHHRNWCGEWIKAAGKVFVKSIDFLWVWMQDAPSWVSVLTDASSLLRTLTVFQNCLVLDGSRLSKNSYLAWQSWGNFSFWAWLYCAFRDGLFTCFALSRDCFFYAWTGPGTWWAIDDSPFGWTNFLWDALHDWQEGGLPSCTVVVNVFSNRLFQRSIWMPF